MSEESKKTVKQIQEIFKSIEDAARTGGDISTKFGDKDLSTKIQKVKESAGEVVKHIEKKSG